MKSGHCSRSTALLATLGIAVGLAACASSDATGTPTVRSTGAVTVPATTLPAASVAVATTAPVTTAVATPATTPVPSANDAPTTTTLGITDAEVADLEKQLDDIDQLLAGVDSDLKQD